MRLVLDTANSVLHADDLMMPCRIGRGGAVDAAAKREGDGATPRGAWRLRGALLRPDKVTAPSTALPWRWLRGGDGWSDDPGDPCYNRPVSYPHVFSAENLWRADGAYDVVIVLGYNDAPPVAGAGSAIFWHCEHADQRPTAGCVATARDALLALLPSLSTENFLVIE